MKKHAMLEEARAVERMQAYIDSHLGEPITMLALARAASYSPCYAARLFRQWTDTTPFSYIRAMRLTAAALRLREEKIRVLDVALDFLFDSHEGFTRAFSRAFGMTPSHYAREAPPIPMFIPYSALEHYRLLAGKEVSSMKSEKTRTIFVQVIERPARKLLLKRGIQAEEYFAYCEEVGCDIWGLLTSVKEALYEPVGLWLPDKLRPDGTSKYVQGVELPMDYAGQVPEGFDLIDLAPCKMMVFQGEPFPDENYSEAIGEVWEAIARYDPALYGFCWADQDAPRFQLAPVGERGYIEARPVRQNG